MEKRTRTIITDQKPEILPSVFVQSVRNSPC